jgi:hypothetical protein
MTLQRKVLTVVLVCTATVAFAQSSPQPATAPTTPTTAKTSPQGTDSKEPARAQNPAPKTSFQGSDSQEPARPATTAKGSFQDTYSKGDGKKTAAARDAGM